MPKKILDEPIDEHKWFKAKVLAAEQDHADDFLHIMGIYKKMMGKSSVDFNNVMVHNKSRVKLVLSKGNFREIRCSSCKALLYRIAGTLHKGSVEIKCRRCGTMNLS